MGAQMSGPYRDQLPAAQWAHQQNIGETSQDRQDKHDGVRCFLHGGPCDNLRVAKYARKKIAAGGRGYAPEYVRHPSDIFDVDYVYKWIRRDPEGVHHYALEGRRGYSQDRSYDDVLVEFRGGPLHRQQEWVQRPESGGLPSIRRQDEVVVYDKVADRAQSNGVYTCHGRIDCRLSGGPAYRQEWVIATETRSRTAGFLPENLSVPNGKPSGISGCYGIDVYRWEHGIVYQFVRSSWAGDCN